MAAEDHIRSFEGPSDPQQFLNDVGETVQKLKNMEEAGLAESDYSTLVTGGLQPTGNLASGYVKDSENRLWDAETGASQVGFIGRLVPEGPIVRKPDGSNYDNSGFSDERYWVKEIRFADPNTLAIFGDPNLGPIPGIIPDYDVMRMGREVFTDLDRIPGGRWVAATNVAEFRSKSHSLNDSEQSGELVVVRRWKWAPGGVCWYFNTPLGGGGRAMAVVRETFDDPDYLVRVQLVRFTVDEDTQRATYSFTGEPLLVRVLPGLRSENYAAFTYAAPDFNIDTTPVIWVTSFQGQWFAEQTVKMRLPRIPNNVRFTECTPPNVEQA